MLKLNGCFMFRLAVWLCNLPCHTALLTSVMRVFDAFLMEYASSQPSGKTVSHPRRMRSCVDTSALPDLRDSKSSTTQSHQGAFARVSVSNAQDSFDGRERSSAPESISFSTASVSACASQFQYRAVPTAFSTPCVRGSIHSRSPGRSNFRLHQP